MNLSSALAEFSLLSGIIFLLCLLSSVVNNYMYLFIFIDDNGDDDVGLVFVDHSVVLFNLEVFFFITSYPYFIFNKFPNIISISSLEYGFIPPQS